MSFNALLEHPTDRVAIINPDDFTIEAVSSHFGDSQSIIGQKLNEVFPECISASDHKKLDKILGKKGIYAWDKKHDNCSGVFQTTILNSQVKWVMRMTPDYSSSYRGLFEKNVAGVYKITLSGYIIDCNTAFAEMLGHNQNELIGTNVNQLYCELENRKDYIDKLIDVKELYNYEILLLGKEGQEVWCLENSFLENGTEDLVINSTLIDITKVKAGEEKYRALFDKSTDCILIINNDKIIDCNARAGEIFGCKKSAILNIKPFDFETGILHRDETDVEDYHRKFNKAIKGESQKMAARCWRLDGSSFHAEIRLSSFQSGNETLVQQIIHDVSDRVVYENAIKESEERFRLLSSVAMESVVFVHDQHIIDCNEQLATLFGAQNRRALIGKRITDFIKQADIERINGMLELGSFTKSELRSTNKGGETLILEASGSFISYQGQKVMAILLYDVTARKRAEQAVEQSSERFKNLVENSPNAVFILTEGRIKYTNSSGINLLGFKDEDDIYNYKFGDFFDKKTKTKVLADLEAIRQGENVDYKELKIQDQKGVLIDIGMKITLTVYDNKPSIQITANNIGTRMLLLQEQVRSQLAEEINNILKTEITEHKITQRKLQETQNFTRNIIESSIDMIIAVDQDFHVTEFNTAAQQQFGYNADEMIGKSADRLYVDGPQFEKVKESLIGLGTYSGEIENRTKKGQTFTALLSASLIKTPKGNIVGSMGVSRDITELKKAEEELKESEERYRDIFDNAADFIISVDEKGKFIYVNNSFRKALGYSEKELKKLTLIEVVAEGSINRKETLFTYFVAEELTITFVSKEGQKIQTEGASSIRHKGDVKHSIRAILSNVSEARRQQRAAMEQKARLESIFNSTENMMIWTLDQEFNITSCNQNFSDALENIFGKRLNIGDECFDVLKNNVHANLGHNQLKAFPEALSGKGQQFELPLQNTEGHPVWLQVFLNPILVDGKIEEISCLSYDITDRIEIDRKVRDSLKEKEVLLQEVHHRVKNNLQVISSILNLQSSFVTDEGTLEILQESQNRIKSMSYIHESLYQTTDFSSVEFTEYIGTLTRNLVQSYHLTTTGVELITKFDETYLSLDQAIPCGLIVNELITNTMKYAFVDIEKPSLMIEIKEKEGKISLLVQDNGIGLPKDFKYEESESLGIQLVYTLVEQLDGKIEVSSKRGASFLITFDKT